MTSRSWQSVTRIVQSGLGRLTRNNVLLRRSSAVKRSLGNGPVEGDERLKRGWTVAAKARAGSRTTAARGRRVR